MRHPSNPRSFHVASAFFLTLIASGALLNACSSDETSSSRNAGPSSSSSAGNGGGDPGGTGGMAGSGGMNGTGGMTGSGGSGGEAPNLNCPPEPATPTALKDIPLKLTEVASGLSRPVLAIGAPGDTTRLYVVEQTGKVRIIKDGTLLPGAFVDVSALAVVPPAAGGSEQGTLGLAFHPNFAQNGRFFINYTKKGSGESVTAEYARSAADPDKANPDAVKVLLEVEDFAGNHNGGMLAFGPDGYLYIGTGDGGGADDPQDTGQDLARKLGKMLRVDVDKYPTPATGNLPVQNGSDPHIWDYGLRNPWRFSFDRCTGDLYIGDVGQYCWEEINVEAKGDGLKNYGWSKTEGLHCWLANNNACNASDNCDQAGITKPVVEHAHTGGNCSIAGGYVYRGTKIPALVGAYLYGDYCSNRIWGFRWKAGQVSDKEEISSELESTSVVKNIMSFGEDAAGELYVLGFNGQVFRIDPE